MNFKELTKIPILPAPQTDIPAETTVYVERDYYGKGYNKVVKNYLYRAEIIDKMLVVTAYHGGEFMWRTFVTDCDCCTQRAGRPKKSTASVLHLTEYGQSYIPVDGAVETVKQYVDTFRKYYTLPERWYKLEQGLEIVNALQTRIRDNKTAERHRKIREATEECMLEIRPPVKAFTDWLKHQSSSIYIIYHTGDDYGVCTHCLKKVERGKAKWKHKEDFVCSHCKRKAKLLCSGRFKDGRIECHTEVFWYAQKTRSGCCIRLFKTHYNLCKNTTYGADKEQVIPITREWNKSEEYQEVCRAFLDLNGNLDKGFVWDNFMQTGENYWCRTNNLYYLARFYTGNLRQALSNYELKYMPWDKISRIAGKTYFYDLVRTLARRPWIEYLLKVGLNSLAEDYLKGRFNEITVAEFLEGKPNPKASLAHILGLNRRELREIIPYDPDINELDLYKLMLHNRAGVAEWRALKPYSKHWKAISTGIEYQPVSRYLNYIARQTELYKQQDHGGIIEVIEDYDDYLQEAKAANYNMEDTATVNPRSLIDAHGEARIDSDLIYYKKTYSKYADKLAEAVKKIAKVKGIIYEDEKYRIAPIMSWTELYRESRFLRHCVASYAKRYADGNCVIFGVRNIRTPDTPMYTLELSGDFRSIRQCRGFKNKSAPEDVMEVVEKWHENLVAKKDRKAG